MYHSMTKEDQEEVLNIICFKHIELYRKYCVDVMCSLHILYTFNNIERQYNENLINKQKEYIQQKEQTIQQKEQTINLMEISKFWKLRNLYIHYKSGIKQGTKNPKLFAIFNRGIPLPAVSKLGIVYNIVIFFIY